VKAALGITLCIIALLGTSALALPKQPAFAFIFAGCAIVSALIYAGLTIGSLIRVRS
jgi:hypothetical protein